MYPSFRFFATKFARMKHLFQCKTAPIPLIWPSISKRSQNYYQYKHYNQLNNTFSKALKMQYILEALFHFREEKKMLAREVFPKSDFPFSTNPLFGSRESKGNCFITEATPTLSIFPFFSRNKPNIFR